jgi:hypothetical protein
MGSSDDCHHRHPSRMGATSLPSGSPSGFVPLERASEDMKFFIMVQSLGLCLIGYEQLG